VKYLYIPNQQFHLSVRLFFQFKELKPRAGKKNGKAVAFKHN